MKNSVYEYRDYKAYIKDFIHSKPGRGHGFKSQIAKSLNCHTAYVTQVLNKEAHFSLEQSEELNHLFGHTKEEARYFLLLVQYARAGTSKLKKHFQEELQIITEKRFVLKNRVDTKETLSTEDQSRYYSSWLYAAIHILITIPQFRTKEAIGEYLHLPLEKVASILEFLVSIGLVQQDGGKYKTGTHRIFLGNDSPMILKHHTNWRMKSIESLDKGIDKDFHYSSVVSLSQEDVDKMKEIFARAVEQGRSLVKDSKEEELYCMTLDFFNVK